MVLPGLVTNITDFGAFVDLGIKTNGLIHISRMGRGGRSALKIQQPVEVVVESVDLARQRIGLRLNMER